MNREANLSTFEMMHAPAHPGFLIRDICLTAVDMSVSEAADHLGIRRQTLSRLVNGHASVSIEMAIRLSKAFGSSPMHWLKMQLAYDLYASSSLIEAIKIDRLMALDVPDD